MTANSLGRVLSIALSAALVGTAWIGLAGGPFTSGAFAQRSQSKEEDDRRKREPQRQERQERQQPKAAPSTPPSRSRDSRPGGDTQQPAANPGARQERPDRQERSAPRTPETQRPAETPRAPDTQRRAAPTEQRREPSKGETPPRSEPQRQVAPPTTKERSGAPDDRRARERDERTRPSGEARPTQQDPAGRPVDRAKDGDRAKGDDRTKGDRAGGDDRARGDRTRGDDRTKGEERDRGGDRAKGFAPPSRDAGRDGRQPDRDGPDSRRPGDRQAGDRDRPDRSGPQRLDDVKKGRVERTEGGRRVIEEPGNRFIIREKDRVVIRRDEGRAFERFGRNSRTRDIGEGRRETVFERRDGTRVFTEVDRNGRILRRYRRDRSGREVVLIDNRRFYRNVGVGIGVTALGIGVGLALAPPAVAIPRNKYIVEYEDASDDDIYEALSAPPVAHLERGYSLEEIRYSRPLREYMRRIDLDTINFEFGSFEVAQDQYPKLARLARIIHRMLERNEAEVFLIEGHTDAVGSDEDNLTLSDRRAEAVAEILMTEFEVPIENLVTQGYGEQFLKVETEAPERANRRVAFRRITPLLGQQDR